jgi:hypothetical protein
VGHFPEDVAAQTKVPEYAAGLTGFPATVAVPGGVGIPGNLLDFAMQGQFFLLVEFGVGKGFFEGFQFFGILGSEGIPPLFPLDHAFFGHGSGVDAKQSLNVAKIPRKTKLGGHALAAVGIEQQQTGRLHLNAEAIANREVPWPTDVHNLGGVGGQGGAYQSLVAEGFHQQNRQGELGARHQGFGA